MPLIPEEIISQIIDQTDIVDTISGYVTLKKAGRNFKGLSPFNHEKTPSFVVSPDKQIFHCYSSGIGGNVISFIMKVERLTFPEAARFLAKRINIEIPENTGGSPYQRGQREEIFDVNALAMKYFTDILVSGADRECAVSRDYLKSRGITLETVKTFQLGLSRNEWDGLIRFLKSKNVPLRTMEKAGLIVARDNKEGYYDRFRNRIMFPIQDTQGRVRAFGARSLDDGGAKYINSPETAVYTKGEHLYGLHLAKQAVIQKDFVVIVEGYMDCIMPQQAGFMNIVASLGTALTTQQIRNIRRFTPNVVMLYDNDKAGEAAMMRSFDVLIEEGISVKVASLEAGEDPDSYIRKHGIARFEGQIERSRDLFEYKLDRLCERYDPRSVSGQAKICDDILPTINRFPHAVMQAGYVNRLAAKLGVSERALNVELQKVREGMRQPAREAVVETKPKISISRPVESSLLKLLLEEKDYIQPTKQEIALDDFQDKTIRCVVSKLFELVDQGVEFGTTDLLSSFDDQDAVQLISRLSTDDQLIAGDKQKIHQDCLSRIKKDRLKNQRKELLEQIKSAEQAGDQTRLEELRQQFLQSTKN